VPDSIKDRVATDFQKVKAESGTRATRIREIIQTAVSQTVGEVKAGSGEIGAIAKDTFSTVVENLNETVKTQPQPEENAASAPEASTSTQPEIQPRSLLVTLLNAIGYKLSHQLKSQVANFDTTSAKRYVVDATSRFEPRYTAIKQRLGKIVTWYNVTKATAEAQGTDPLQQRQTQVEHQVGTVGAAVAKQEQQIRQQVKQFLQTAASRM